MCSLIGEENFLSQPRTLKWGLKPKESLKAKFEKYAAKCIVKHWFLVNNMILILIQKE